MCISDYVVQRSSANEPTIGTDRNVKDKKKDDFNSGPILILIGLKSGNLLSMYVTFSDNTWCNYLDSFHSINKHVVLMNKPDISQKILTVKIVSESVKS